MVIRGRAPLRVSFGGGGTDVEPFCLEQGGAIIGSTINKYAYCSIIPRDDEHITVHSLDFDMTVKYNTNENYVYDGKLDLVTAALKAMDIKQGCEVYLQCDAPAGSGLGTSSTVMVALLTAMARWKGIEMDNYAMADLAYGVERCDLKIAGGYQDQYAATFGGFNFIEFHGLCGSGGISSMSFSITCFCAIPAISTFRPISSGIRSTTTKSRMHLKPCVK